MSKTKIKAHAAQLHSRIDVERLIATLNKGLEHELATLVRYLHHSFLVFGPGREPIVNLLRTRATDSIAHAVQLGEKITYLGGHPSVKIQEVLDPSGHSIEDMLEDDLQAEREALQLYMDALKDVEDDVIFRVMFEEIIKEEHSHLEELEKLLRNS